MTAAIIAALHLQLVSYVPICTDAGNMARITTSFDSKYPSAFKVNRRHVDHFTFKGNEDDPQLLEIAVHRAKLWNEAPETLREPVLRDFATVDAYVAALAKFNERGDWATE